MKSSPVKKTVAGRKKLLKDNFEWTDEAIAAVHATGNPENESKSPSASRVTNILRPAIDLHESSKSSPNDDNNNAPIEAPAYVDTMEAKIARVQQRKREEKDRATKRAMKPAPAMPTTHALGEYQRQQMALGEVDTLGFKTASYFNQYFAQYVAERPHLLEGVTTTFPLHLFDDSTFDEVLPTPIPLHTTTDSSISSSTVRALRENDPAGSNLGGQDEGVDTEMQEEAARRELLLSSGEHHTLSRHL